MFVLAKGTSEHCLHELAKGCLLWLRAPVSIALRNAQQSLAMYQRWPEDALEAVAHKFLKEVRHLDQRLELGANEANALGAVAAVSSWKAWGGQTLSCFSFRLSVDIMPDMLKVIVSMCKLFHMQVIDLSKRFLEQTGRYNYVTPTSYLELIVAFTTLVGAKRTETTGAVFEVQNLEDIPVFADQPQTRQGNSLATLCTCAANVTPQVLGAQHRYEKGLDKLEFTARQVSVMRLELQALKPNLERKVCACGLEGGRSQLGQHTMLKERLGSLSCAEQLECLSCACGPCGVYHTMPMSMAFLSSQLTCLTSASINVAFNKYCPELAGDS
eukprot:1158867-Pelagomonas_calceolata.AAC.10